MKTALVPLANGVEEMEATIVIDLLRRAGVEVTCAGLVAGTVSTARGMRIVPDCLLDAVVGRTFDIVALPGGANGTEALLADTRVGDIVRRHAAAGKIVAAVCAAPRVLHKAGLLSGKRATSYPSAAEKLTGVEWRDEAVVSDGNIITSQGAGTTIQFALEIIRRAVSSDAAAGIAKAIVLR